MKKENSALKMSTIEIGCSVPAPVSMLFIKLKIILIYCVPPGLRHRRQLKICIPTRSIPTRTACRSPCTLLRFQKGCRHCLHD